MSKVRYVFLKIKETLPICFFCKLFSSICYWQNSSFSFARYRVVFQSKNIHKLSELKRTDISFRFIISWKSIFNYRRIMNLSKIAGNFPFLKLERGRKIGSFRVEGRCFKRKETKTILHSVILEGSIAMKMWKNRYFQWWYVYEYVLYVT